jgi:hypothetical protein
MKDIIVSSKRLNIGDEVRGLTDPYFRLKPEQPLKILRTASEKEYHECLAEYGVRETIPFFDEVWFYEVSMD